MDPPLATGGAGGEVSFAGFPALDCPMFMFIIIMPPFIIPPAVGAAGGVGVAGVGPTGGLKHCQSKKHNNDEIFIRPFLRLKQQTTNAVQKNSTQ